MDRQEIIHTAYGLLLNESRDLVLIVKNLNETWSLPGGRQEGFETLHETVIREFHEETSIGVVVQDLISVSENLGQIHDFFFVFKVVLANEHSYSDVEVKLPSDISQYEWVAFEVAEKRVPWYGNFGTLINLTGLNLVSSR